MSLSRRFNGRLKTENQQPKWANWQSKFDPHLELDESDELVAMRGVLSELISGSLGMPALKPLERAD